MIFVFVVLPVLAALGVLILAGWLENRRDDGRHRRLSPEDQQTADLFDAMRAEDTGGFATVRAAPPWEAAIYHQLPLTSPPAATRPAAGAVPGPGSDPPPGDGGTHAAVHAPGPGTLILPDPIPHNGPWDGHPQIHHDEHAPAQVLWEPEPRDGHACAPPGRLLPPLLPAVVILRRIIIAAEPLATNPWADEVGTFTKAITGGVPDRW